MLGALGALVSISYLAGTIEKTEEMRFKKIVYRATRGKALTYFKDMGQAELKQYTGEKIKTPKTVYVVIFQEGPNIRERLVKICDSFMGSRFDLPSQSDLTEIHRKIVELNRRVDDSTALLNTTSMRLKDFLRDI